MDDAVLELGEFAAVPAVGGADKVAGDALQAVDVVAVAVGAFLESVGGILVAAIHAAVAVVVHRAVAHVVLVHQVHDIGDGFGIVGGIAINLHIEDVAAQGKGMVGRLDLGLMLGRALVIDRHVVAVGVVDLVGHAGDFAEVFTVAAGKLSAKALGWRGEHTVVVLIALAEVVDALTHVTDDFQAQLLRLVALAVVMADKGYQTLGKANIADAQRALVDDALYLVTGFEFVGAYPELRHEQGELLSHRGLLILVAVIQLTCGDFQHIVQLGKETVDAFLLVLDVHALDGKTHDIDGREREVATSDRRFLTEAVVEHASAASHCCQFILIALGVVGTPQFMMVIGGIKIDKIREETACRHLASQLVQVIVGVLGLVAHTRLLFPNLDGEDGG